LSARGGCFRPAFFSGELGQRFEHLRGVALWGDRFPDLRNLAVAVDQKRAPHDSQKRPTQKTLHPPRAVGLDGLEVRIAQQREVDLLLGFELCLRLDAIGATAQDRRAGLIEFCFCVAKLGRFRDSTRCVRLGEKVKHDGLAAQVRQRDFAAVIGFQPELRRLVSYL
jgi:hypothetical protein